MRRLPTTLTKLSDAEQRLKEEAEALAKKRAALVRQRERLEQALQTERYIAVGKLVEQIGTADHRSRGAGTDAQNPGTRQPTPAPTTDNVQYLKCRHLTESSGDGMKALHFAIAHRTNGTQKGPAAAHVRYITRAQEGAEAHVGYVTRTTQRTREDLVATGYGNLPAWAHDDPAAFFAAV